MIATSRPSGGAFPSVLAGGDACAAPPLQRAPGSSPSLALSKAGAARARGCSPHGGRAPGCSPTASAFPCFRPVHCLFYKNGFVFAFLAPFPPRAPPSGWSVFPTSCRQWRLTVAVLATPEGEPGPEGPGLSLAPSPAPTPPHQASPASALQAGRARVDVAAPASLTTVLQAPPTLP